MQDHSFAQPALSESAIRNTPSNPSGTSSMSNNPQDIEVIVQKITKIQQAQAEVITLMHALNRVAMVVETDLEGNIIYVNDLFCAVSKYPAHELLNQNHNVLRSGHQNEAIYAELWQTIQSAKVWNGYLKNKTKEGQFYWVELTIFPQVNSQGQILKYVAVSFEVTQLVEQGDEIDLHLLGPYLKNNASTNQQYQQLTHKLRQAHDEVMNLNRLLSHTVAITETDLEGIIVQANEKYLQLLGYQTTDIAKEKRFLVEPEQMPKQFYHDLWKTIQSGSIWRGMFSVRPSSGNELWLDTTIIPEFNAEGKVHKYFAISIDVTVQEQVIQEHKASLETLTQQSELLNSEVEHLRKTNTELEKLQLLLFHQVSALNAAALLMEVDILGKVIFVNDFFAERLKHAKTSLLGQQFDQLSFEVLSPHTYDDLWQSINMGQVWRGQLAYLDADEKPFWVRTVIYPIANEVEELVKFIVIHYDISYEHQRIAQLTNQNLELLKDKEELNEKLASATLEQSVSNAHDSDLQAKFELLQSELHQIKERENEYQYLIQDQESLLAEFPNKIGDLNSEIERMRIDYLNLQELKAERESYALDVEWGLNQTITGLREEISVWSIKYDEVRFTNEALHDQIKELKSNSHSQEVNSTIFEDNQRLEEKVANLARELAAKQEQIAELEHQISSKGLDNSAPNATPDTLAKNELLTQELSEAKEQLAILSEIRDTNLQLQLHIADLESHISALQSLKADLEQGPSAAQPSASNDSPSSDWLKDELASLRRELKEMVLSGTSGASGQYNLASLQDFEAEKARLQHDISLLDTKIRQFELRVKELEEETELYRKEIELQRNNFVDARHDWNAQLNRTEAQLFEYQHLVEESNRNLASFQERERLWLLEEERLKGLIAQLQSGSPLVDSYPAPSSTPFLIVESNIGAYSGTMLYNVLVIDYDCSLQAYVKERFTEGEIGFHYANEIPKAIQLYNDIKPNLVLIEHKLPFINGYHLLDAIRSLYNDKDTKIVALLSKSLAQQASTYVANGFNAVIDTSNWPPTLRQFFLAGY
jgi:PAS domain S-box-containing protein